MGCCESRDKETKDKENTPATTVDLGASTKNPDQKPADA